MRNISYITYIIKSFKTTLNKRVFLQDLKPYSDGLVLIFEGNSFHNLGATAENAQFP